MSVTLVVLAAGRATRFGSLKQLTPVGPAGEVLLDFAVFDASQAGCDSVVVVIRSDLQTHFEGWNARHPGLGGLVRFVHQDAGGSPESAAPRSAPWGTGHAVLAAARIVSGPMVVVNADDFYGRAAYDALVRFLRDPATRDDDAALIGYRLGDTLSPHGGVSRAVCTVQGGRLTSMTELLDVRAGPAGITGRLPTGESRRLTGDETISMNIWGFRPGVLPELAAEFERFRETPAGLAGPEFRLSDAVHALVERERISCAVLPSASAEWFGMTFAPDRERATRRLASFLAAGVYPPRLFPDRSWN